MDTKTESLIFKTTVSRKYIETWSKPVNILKTFERVQYISIIMHPRPNSMLCLRHKLPESQELPTQMQSHRWREISLRIFVTDCPKKKEI